jgi:hypothetical protein
MLFRNTLVKPTVEGYVARLVLMDLKAYCKPAVVIGLGMEVGSMLLRHAAFAFQGWLRRFN